MAVLELAFHRFQVGLDCLRPKIPDLLHVGRYSFQQESDIKQTIQNFDNLI